MGFQPPAHGCHAPCGVVDIGVARDENDVEGASGFFLRHRQEGTVGGGRRWSARHRGLERWEGLRVFSLLVDGLW